MNDNFFAYLQWVELITFFTGYPLVYAIIQAYFKRQSPLLPYSYALVATLYLGLRLKNLYPDYSLEAIQQSISHPLLILWGLLGLVFWIPAVARKNYLSLLHSTVFFVLLIKDLFQEISISATDKSILRNDMKLYTISVLVHMASIIVIVLIALLLRQLRKNSAPLSKSLSDDNHQTQ